MQYCINYEWQYFQVETFFADLMLSERFFQRAQQTFDLLQFLTHVRPHSSSNLKSVKINSKNIGIYVNIQNVLYINMSDKNNFIAK